MSIFARRSFMSMLSAAGLGTVLGGIGRRRAQAADGFRHLVLVFASGGWDTTWSFEPKDGTAFDIPVGTRTVIGTFVLAPGSLPDRPAAAAR